MAYLFKGLTQKQLSVFEKFCIGEDEGHEKRIINFLLAKGMLEEISINNYIVPVDVHMQWCEWVSRYDENGDFNDCEL